MIILSKIMDQTLEITLTPPDLTEKACLFSLSNPSFSADTSKNRVYDTGLVRLIIH